MSADSPGQIRLIVRADDMGMTHGCNVAVRKCFESGILTCAAIQAPAPWAAEAAAMGREHPDWCLGAHLTPIAEWVGYRWRPVLPYDKVSTLVDRNGFFKQTVPDFYATPIDYEQLLAEFTAQVELLQSWGLKLGYVDNHYIDGYKPPDPSYAEVVRTVSRRFGLPISEQSNELRPRGIFSAPPDAKEERLVAQLRELTPGLWLLVHHLLEDDGESRVLRHANPADVMPEGVWNHRSAETRALRSGRVTKAIQEKGILLVSYRDLG